MKSLIFVFLFALAVDAASLDAAAPVMAHSEALSAETRHQLVKAHGILMVLAWLFLIPSAILFARMLKDAFKHKKPFGIAIWFHVHRGFNIIAIVLMAISFLLIFISTGWKWKGIGSGSKKPTELHTTVGVAAFALALAQPFFALLRCSHSNPKRRLFNWGHFFIAVVAYICAMIAFVVATTEFKKLWSDSVLQTILVLIPLVLLLFLWPLTQIWLPKKDEEDDEKETESFLGTSSKYRKRSKEGYSMRLSTCFWACGMMLATSIAVSLLIANGYKPQ